MYQVKAKLLFTITTTVDSAQYYLTCCSLVTLMVVAFTIYTALQYIYDFATSFLLRDFQYSYARKPLGARCYTCQVGFKSRESVSNQNSGRSGWKRTFRCQFNIGTEAGVSRQPRSKSVSESFSVTGKSKKVVHSDDVKGRSWANHFQF